MKERPVVGVVGATGLVGSEMVQILSDRKFPLSGIRLFASEDSAGEVYSIGGHEAVVEILNKQSFTGIDIALFATSAELSAEFVPHAVESGAVVIDNSSYFRMNQDIPLVVPEVNFQVVTDKHRIIANPNCSTIQLVAVLHRIHQAAPLKRVVVSTYQAVSGAGKAALDELWEQSLGVFNQRDIVPEAFPHQIAFNCIPQIDRLLDDGYTAEEYKIINESRKILDLSNLPITATAVRVPVFHSHAESVNIELEKPLSPEMVKTLFQGEEGIVVADDQADYPMQLQVSGSDEVHIGRIRQDFSVPYGLNLWIVADNVRKGAALNAIQIAEKLLPESSRARPGTWQT